MPVAGCSSELICVLLMVFSFGRDFRGELVQAFAKYAVERGKRMDDVGERLQGRPQLDREHELANDLAGARRDQRGTDEHSALSVRDQLERSAVKVMDVAPGRLGRVRRGDGDVNAFGSGGGLR